MRRFATAVVFASLIAATCGGNSDDSDGTTRARTSAPTTTTRTAAPAATEPGAASTRISGGEVEVQGIVGAVDEDGRTIEINRLQGADVEVIEVDAGTRITSARGPTLRLGDLRPSDRIIARGTLAGGVLVAMEIEVGQAVPGAVPGG